MKKEGYFSMLLRTGVRALHGCTAYRICGRHRYSTNHVQTDRQTDGRTDGLTDGLTDRQTDRQTDS
jgi:hypothetical protein